MAKWMVANKSADFAGIGEAFSIDPVIARIIRNRGVVGEENVRKYLFGSKNDLYDPFLLKDMDIAVCILKNKIKEQKSIRIVGDYDIDGICASYILLKGVENAGGKADVAIPNRITDGYGINPQMIKDAFEEGIDTIITCDNGIAATDAVKLAKKYGMTIIVTDHHEVPFINDNENGKKIEVLPNADAVVDPKREECRYPFSGICGAVVAYKLIQAMLGASLIGSNLENELLIFAAFATVGDVMELQDENRIIVKTGLKAMADNKNIGLNALIDACKLDKAKITPYHIGFVLGPCINATGRLDSAKRALDLFVEKDRANADIIAHELQEYNDVRKGMTAQGVEKALEIIETKKMESDKVLVIYLPGLHESLAGIVAGRIKERYGKPAFVLTNAEEGVKGSGRSIEAYSMYEELCKVKELLGKFGGHKLAAGLSMPTDNTERFREAINQKCALKSEDFEEIIHIDMAMPLSYISESLVKQFELLEPCGTGNKHPLFVQKNMCLFNGNEYGKTRNVAKFSVADEMGRRFSAVIFDKKDQFDVCIDDKYGEGSARKLYTLKNVPVSMDIVFEVSENEFRGKKSIELIIRGFA